MNWYKIAQINNLNLLTSSEQDLRTAFDLMEGEGFFNRSINKGNYSIKSALEALERDRINREEEKQWAIENNEPWTEEEYNNPKGRIVGATIYGEGGWNRYFVRRNGDILFSSGHANKNETNNAKDLGFQIH